jgi:hypothetical protein
VVVGGRGCPARKDVAHNGAFVWFVGRSVEGAEEKMQKSRANFALDFCMGMAYNENIKRA